MTSTLRSLRRRVLPALTAALLLAVLLPAGSGAASDVPPDSDAADTTPIPERVLTGLDRVESAAGVVEGPVIVVDPETQTLYLVDRQRVHASWPVSTGRGGISSRAGSGGTPQGTHRIGRVLVGRTGEVFVGRRATGRIRPPTPRAHGRAHITTAVLTLVGQEASNQNSARRGIYIHGTNLEGSLGRPLSGGCIRMSNQAVRELACLIGAGTWVHVLGRS